MGVFNKKGRMSNSIKTTTVNVANNIVSLILGFAYRTVFIYFLSQEYLGLNGLFSDILNILSLAELGIGGAINYRLYSPINMDDYETVSALMDFYKKVYRIIAIVILIVGMIIMPFIKFLIKPDGGMPPDVNLYLLFGLFLFQSLTSYFFAYKQSLLHADQRGYIAAFFSIAVSVFKFIAQVSVLVLTKNYLLTIVVVIVFNLLYNIFFSVYITRRYKEVFSIKAKVNKETTKAILKDTKALLLHKIGGTVLQSTDTIVITAILGLAINGVYSNYVYIIGAVKMLISQLYASSTSSIGNLFSSDDIAHQRKVFDRFQFMTLWIASFCTIALMSLLNPFIEVWLDRSYLLTSWSVLLMCVSFYISLSRNAQMTFITASGLFVKDKYRPLIEAGLNLGISVGLAYVMGINGVFLGTIISCLLTVFWREPHILYRFALKQRVMRYWVKYIVVLLITLIVGSINYYIIRAIPNGVGYLILKFAITLIVPNVIFILITFKMTNFKYFATIVLSLIKKVFRIRSKSIVIEPPDALSLEELGSSIEVDKLQDEKNGDSSN